MHMGIKKNVKKYYRKRNPDTDQITTVPEIICKTVLDRHTTKACKDKEVKTHAFLTSAMY